MTIQTKTPVTLPALTYSTVWPTSINVSSPSPGGKMLADVTFRPYTTNAGVSALVPGVSPIRYQVDLGAAAATDPDFAVIMQALEAKIQAMAQAAGKI
jgi:hypothetical protein